MKDAILAEIDAAIAEAMQAGVFPGAALWIGWRGETIQCKAYGHATTEPELNWPVTTKTLYDLASLTKVVATTTAIMQLVEQGRLNLTDTLAYYLPQFGTDSQKSSVTIWHVLTHTAGLPVVQLYKQYTEREALLEAIYRLELLFPPGTQHLYADFGFILLGELIRRVTGQALDEYTRKNIYEPLGMYDTMYNPPAELLPRIAPTEVVEWRGGLIQGVVHDEHSWRLGGVSGHAGLFSTVEDLGKFCTMLLGQGSSGATRIFSPATLQQFTTPHRVDFELPFGLGWMLHTPYFMGNLLNQGTFGHTGFTGTTLWVTPSRQLAAVLLTNRVWPTRQGPPLNPCRQRIANALAELPG